MDYEEFKNNREREIESNKHEYTIITIVRCGLGHCIHEKERQAKVNEIDKLRVCIDCGHISVR